MIEISRSLLEILNTHGERAFPRESCGLLVGRVNADGNVIVTRTVESENVAEGNGHDRFEINPQVHFELMRKLENTEMGIVGHYHSHPCHSAKPSPCDIDMAYEPNFVWLITAVAADGHAQETRAWRLVRETHNATELRLQIA